MITRRTTGRLCAAGRSSRVATALGAGLCVLALAACGSAGTAGTPQSSGTGSSNTGSNNSGSSASGTARGSSTASSSGSAAATPTAATTGTPAPQATVPTGSVSTAPAVPLDRTVDNAGVSVALGAITSFDAVGVAPGEIGGPAVAVPVTLRNGTGSAIDANAVLVTLTDAAGIPAGPLSDEPANPIAGELAPGAAVTGVYAFTLAADDRAGVQITVSYRTATPVVLFSGTIAG